MVHLLFMRDFAFMDKREVKSFDVMPVPENRETGWILEVSLRYSEPLHNIHNSLPLASVKRVDFGCRAYRMLSNFFRKLHGLSDDDPLPNLGKVEKLLTTLEDKDQYVIHYRNSSYTSVLAWK